MAENPNDLFYMPFEGLSALIEARGWRLVDLGIPTELREVLPDDADELEDETLFFNVMADAQPMDNRLYGGRETTRPSRIKSDATDDEDQAVLQQLNDLIRCGTGFVVSATSEFVAGRAPDVVAGTAQRLHRGAFSIQAHIDLHGMVKAEAKRQVDRFLDDAIRGGKRAVLLVHGRGLSSQGPPVLKGQVIQWLTRGRWRKFVIAYASARLCDGGAGATYVLLRRGPVSGRGKPL